MRSVTGSLLVSCVGLAACSDDDDDNDKGLQLLLIGDQAGDLVDEEGESAEGPAWIDIQELRVFEDAGGFVFELDLAQEVPEAIPDGQDYAYHEIVIAPPCPAGDITDPACEGSPAEGPWQGAHFTFYRRVEDGACEMQAYDATLGFFTSVSNGGEVACERLGAVLKFTVAPSWLQTALGQSDGASFWGVAASGPTGGSEVRDLLDHGVVHESWW